MRLRPDGRACSWKRGFPARPRPAGRPSPSVRARARGGRCHPARGRRRLLFRRASAGAGSGTVRAQQRIHHIHMHGRADGASLSLALVGRSWRLARGGISRARSGHALAQVVVRCGRLPRRGDSGRPCRLLAALAIAAGAMELLACSQDGIPINLRRIVPRGSIDIPIERLID